MLDNYVEKTVRASWMSHRLNAFELPARRP